ncbi:hypothetical protein C1645_815141 [Glomus cerebriforme]|uniref:Uncharacterized protein n=1 Tax=Glomus cerebriforme TaxID=658196 RepID=A0A397TP26_9GLOM|nr:hypothetical protein C1645_815141 [Glomus cerebriforme]
MELDYILNTPKEIFSLIKSEQNKLFYINEGFNQNKANLLISEFFWNDGTSEPTIKSQKERWTGRKKLEIIGLPQYINEDKFILYMSKEGVLLGKVLSIYRLVSNQHAYVSFSQNIDSLSYLSVAAFANTDSNLFSPACKSGGNLFAHITSKQVIYHFDNSSLDITNVVNLVGYLCMLGNSWQLFDFFSQKQVMSIVATIVD